MDTIVKLYEEHAYIGAAAVVLGALLLAGVVDLIVTRGLRRIAARTRTDLDDEFFDAIRRPLFLSLLFAGCGVALQRLDPPETGEFIVEGILITLVVLLWAGAGMRISKSVLKVASARADDFRVINERTIPLFDIIFKTVIVAGAAYGILLAWDIDITAWLASAGILGIAIGFAAKDTLSNFFSGIFILADAPYKLGDFIVLDSGERGRVTDIGVRSTRILTRDDIEIIIPNAAIANAKIINETGGPHDKERVRLTIGVAYGSDVDHVRAVLKECAAESPLLSDDPAPRVRFRSFGDSALIFQLMAWIDEPVLRGKALDRLHTTVYKRFQQEGIQIPFPQTDVHLFKAD